MTDPWLTIIGLGEDGLSGLSEASRAALDRAEVIFGGPRHLELADAGARGRAWPVPFSTAPVLAERGRPVVVLASGDPFWYGAGGSLVPDLAAGRVGGTPRAVGLFACRRPARLAAGRDRVPRSARGALRAAAPGPDPGRTRSFA